MGTTRGFILIYYGGVLTKLISISGMFKVLCKRCTPDPGKDNQIKKYKHIGNHLIFTV